MARCELVDPNGCRCMLDVGHTGAHRREKRHTCHAEGCTNLVQPKMWGCLRHWYMLPLKLRDEIWRTYKPGQENTKDPSPEYEAAAAAAVEAVAKKEGRR